MLTAGRTLGRAASARIRFYSTPSIDKFLGVVSQFAEGPSPAKKKPKSPLSAPSQPAPTPIPPAEHPLLHFITSQLMTHGHRHRAERRTSMLLMHLHTLTRSAPFPILQEAIRIASPSVRVVNARIMRKIVPRPSALTEKQRVHTALKWIMKSSEAAPGRTVEERLAREMVAIVRGDSEVLKTKTQTHVQAMLNRGSLKSR